MVMLTDVEHLRWQQMLRDIHEQAKAGVFLHLVRDIDRMLAAPRNLQQLQFAPLDKSCTAIALQALRYTANHYRQHVKRGTPKLCPTCDRSIRTLRNAVALIAIPNTPDQSTCGLSSLFCPACAARPNLRDSARDLFRETWPNIRVLDPR
jgi:hypothetical protein